MKYFFTLLFISLYFFPAQFIFACENTTPQQFCGHVKVTPEMIDYAFDNVGFTFTIPKDYRYPLYWRPESFLELSADKKNNAYEGIGVVVRSNGPTKDDIGSIVTNHDAARVISTWYTEGNTPNQNKLLKAYTKYIGGYFYVIKEESSVFDGDIVKKQAAYTIQNNKLYKIEFSDSEKDYKKDVKKFLSFLESVVYEKSMDVIDISQLEGTIFTKTKDRLHFGLPSLDMNVDIVDYYERKAQSGDVINSKKAATLFSGSDSEKFKKKIHKTKRWDFKEDEIEKTFEGKEKHIKATNRSTDVYIENIHNTDFYVVNSEYAFEVFSDTASLRMPFEIVKSTTVYFWHNKILYEMNLNKLGGVNRTLLTDIVSNIHFN